MAASSTSGDVNYPVVNGPTSVVDGIKSEASKTDSELRGLKDAKVTPSQTTSTGQSLTHYHSLLYSLLSWERPRATTVSYLSVVTLILAARYLPLLRWFFKFLYIALAVTGGLEFIGQTLLSQSLVSAFRPRKYYTIPKETIEGVLEDIGQLFDFFLIEFQRILFAENVIHTLGALVAAFSSYWLIKILPLWGLSLIAVTVAYLGPLVYLSNKEIIDEQIVKTQELISAQATQVRELANEHTAKATGLVKQYATDYTSKAQDYIGNRRSASPEVSKVPAPSSAIKTEPASPPSQFASSDFPAAPQSEPVAAEPTAAAPSTETKEPLLA